MACGRDKPGFLNGGSEFPTTDCVPDGRFGFEFSTDFRSFRAAFYTKREDVSQSRARLNTRGPRAARKLLGANIDPPRIEIRLLGPCVCSRNGADVSVPARSPLSGTSAKLPGGSGVMA